MSGWLSASVMRLTETKCLVCYQQQSLADIDIMSGRLSASVMSLTKT